MFMFPAPLGLFHWQLPSWATESTAMAAMMMRDMMMILMLLMLVNMMRRRRKMAWVSEDEG
jgi:hypothetical protein